MPEAVFTVGRVNAYIKNLFENDFALRRIAVRGEVSNCKYHSSGHIYFTLKDTGGVLNAVMFKGNRPRGLTFQMQNGNQVIVRGSIMIYERDGTYQLYAREIVPDGTGDLFLRFEETKKRLEEMGMFSAEYKRPIPAHAQTVGVVTAATGAAVRDIENVIGRRNPAVRMVLYPAQVQGEKAAPSIVKGIETLDAMGLDVIIVGRGGGSIEDLWAFNEEIVARAIFDCSTPVISAVGHETDFTIADFVADMRAPTPSAAAELAVYDAAAFLTDLAAIRQRLNRNLRSALSAKRLVIEQLKGRLEKKSPAYLLDEKRHSLMLAQESIKAGMRTAFELKKAGLSHTDELLRERMKKCAQHEKSRLEVAAVRLDAGSPLKKLSQGWGYITNIKGERLGSVSNVLPGEDIGIRLYDGRIYAQVKETETDEC